MAKDDGRRGSWWWIDRWRRSEAFIDFTLAQQGAYRNLIDELWLRGGVLPDDERTLARASGDPIEWPEMRDKVMAKFYRVEDGWRHATVDEVMATSVTLADKRATSGRKGYAAVGRGGKGRFTGKDGQADGQTSENTTGKHSGNATGKTVENTTGKVPPIRGRNPLSVVRYPSPSPDTPPPPPRASGADAPDPPGFDRAGLVSQGYAHIRAITAVTGEDGADPLKRASLLDSGYYLLGHQLDSARPEHLIRTVDRLRDEAQKLASRRPATTPEEAALLDRRGELAAEFVAWYRAHPQEGIEPTLQRRMPNVALNAWPGRVGLTPFIRIEVLRRAVELLEADEPHRFRDGPIRRRNGGSPLCTLCERDEQDERHQAPVRAAT